MKLFAALGFFLAALPACKSTASTAPAPEPAASAATVAAARATSPLAIPGATVAAFPNLPIPARFASEAKGRPQGIKPTVEDVYTALKAAGIPVESEKQHLASSQGARYCVGARVGEGADPRLDLSVCEYATPEVAQLGRDWSHESMKAVVPNRTLYVNRNTLLIVREAQKNPENDALVEKAATVFAQL